jgi:predicted phage terminase large subunit-like protein
VAEPETAVENPLSEAVSAHSASVLAERIVCESSYYWFFLSAWSILEPETPLIDNWHIRYLCDTLQAEIERIAKREPKTLDLIVNEPPRSAKSLITTVCLCPWAWTKAPHLRFINVSYSERLAVDHCMASRRIVESEWYQRLWGKRYEITSDQNQKAYFENSERGFRRACPSRSVTGSGADVIVWDDPQNPEMAESEVERENTKRVFGGTGYTRLNDQKVGLRVVIQQRLHEDDLTGHLLTNSTGKYRHICLPAELTEDVSPPEVRQYYEDGLLFPARFGWNQLAEAKLATNLGAYGYAAQMLQSPAPPEGGTFKRHWWRFWVPKGKTLPAPAYKDAEGKLQASTVVELPETFDSVINSWDTAVEGGSTHDYWAGGVWARVGASKFLLHQVHEQMDYPIARKAVKALYAFWPNTGALLIEKASNGPAVKADLQREIPGIITIPTGKLSKEDRVHYSDTVPYAAQVEAGNVYLPHPALAPWVEGFITEHAKFPKGTHDDQVDQSAQAINHLTQVRHVWPYYQAFNTIQHRKFDVRWANALHYGALYLGKDMSISLLAALWDIADHKLYIYGCLLASQWSARGLAVQMVRGMHLTEHRCHGIYGNDASEAMYPQTRVTAKGETIRCRQTQLHDNLCRGPVVPGQCVLVVDHV